MLMIVAMLLSAIVGAVTDDLGLPIWLIFFIFAGGAALLFQKGGQADRLTRQMTSRRRRRRAAAGHIIFYFLCLSLAGTAAYIATAGGAPT
ncbi:hypothetical protein FHR22_001449 [Sphingopyxis panaciterrae]|uniref:hypothetical protein n=1 Tax=Sphingopyxis panaciterrae TaxID=363841 RepID=UPI0014226242|nr:hypothetical protein [Sphingopyxis panaciterrae]NIJ36800.1 hypothetical protein [Sphingopyxis panaciterrae]